MADRRSMALEDAKNLRHYETYLTDAELAEVIEDLAESLRTRHSVRRVLATRMVVFEIEDLVSKVVADGPTRESLEVMVTRVEELRAEFVRRQEMTDEELEQLDKRKD